MSFLLITMEERQTLGKTNPPHPLEEGQQQRGAWRRSAPTDLARLEASADIMVGPSAAGVPCTVITVIVDLSIRIDTCDTGPCQAPPIQNALGSVLGQG